MNPFSFLRTRQWVWARRIALVVIILVLAFRNYGGSLSSWFRGSTQRGDIILTKSEFRPDLEQAKPAWIIGLKNQSTTTTYEEVELEATYKDSTGKVIETDKLIIHHKLVPGNEQLIASTDIKARPNATIGELRVVGASP